MKAELKEGHPGKEMACPSHYSLLLCLRCNSIVLCMR